MTNRILGHQISYKLGVAEFFFFSIRGLERGEESRIPIARRPFPLFPSSGDALSGGHSLLIQTFSRNMQVRIRFPRSQS